VYFVFEKFRGLRGVGSVAVSAIHHFSSNIDVGLAKRSLFVIMAFATQGLNGLDD
jgi:hypothetical protein